MDAHGAVFVFHTILCSALTRTDIAVASQLHQRKSRKMTYHSPERTDVLAPGAPAEDRGGDDCSAEDGEKKAARRPRFGEHVTCMFSHEYDDEAGNPNPYSMSAQKCGDRQKRCPTGINAVGNHRHGTVATPAPRGDSDGEDHKRPPYRPDDKICEVVLYRPQECIE